MVFGAGAAFMTVLSCASRATHETVGKRAEAFGATVIVDTITESGKAELLPPGITFPASFGYVAVHSPTDARLAGNKSSAHIDAVKHMHERGFRVSLAGGIGPTRSPPSSPSNRRFSSSAAHQRKPPIPKRYYNGFATDCPIAALAGRGTGNSRSPLSRGRKCIRQCCRSLRRS